MMRKPFFVRAAALVCFAAVTAAGCRPKAAVPIDAQSAEAVKAQVQQKQVQQYILKRREAARKNSRTHTVH